MLSDTDSETGGNENNVVPIPDLVWHCEFIPGGHKIQKIVWGKKELLAHEATSR